MKKRRKKLLCSCLLLFRTVTLTLILREEGSGAFAKVKEVSGLLLLSGGDSEKHIAANFPGASPIPVLVVLGCAAHSCRTISCLLLAGAENCFPLGSASRFPNPTIGIVVLGFKNEDLTKKTPVPSCLRQPSKCSTSLCLPLSPSVFFFTCSS